MIEFLSLTDRASTVSDGVVLAAHLDPVLRLEYSNDGVHLCSSSRRGPIVVWNNIHHTQICRIEAGIEWLGTFSLHPTSPYILSWKKTGLKVWDRNSGRQMGNARPDAEMSCCSYTPCARYVISGHSDNRIRIWDAYTLDVLRVYDIGHVTAMRILFCYYENRSICVIMTEFTIQLIDYKAIRESDPLSECL